jgi:hypothetical protein
MKRETKAWLIILTPFFVGLLIGILVGSCLSRGSKEAVETAAQTEEEASQPETPPQIVIEDAEVEEVIPQKEKKDIIYSAPKPRLSQWFADLNEDHLVAAKKYGLSRPPKTRDDVGYEGLVKITDNDYIKMWDLKYSVPYLTKNAAQELDIISRAFHDSLANHKLLNYKIVVSSVLRTEEDVQKLRRHNSNASANSAHCYGTTFDIANQRYWRDDEESQDAKMEPFELNKVMSEVRKDRKKQGKILCKYERNQHCFHITVCY